MSIASLQITDLHAGYREERFTPVEVINAVYDRIEAYPDAAVWISRLPRNAVLDEAGGLDLSDIEELPLFGIPFAVKDNIDVAGLETTAACPDFAYLPEADATVVARLRAAGALVIGKTNLDQFATGLVGVRSPYGAPRCVFDDRYISGGSSSGSAVAVAAGLVSFSLGTDTAGSGRVPAALNNIVGIKPTKGHLSTTGVIPACRSLDCVTVFAGTVGDGDLVRRIATAEDAADPYSRPAGQQTLPLTSYRFGVLAEDQREFFGDTDAARLYEAAIDRLAGLGGTPTPIDYRPFKSAAALLYDGPWVSERTAAIQDFIGASPDAVHKVVRGIIEGGNRFSAVDAFEGQYRLEALRKTVAPVWRDIDLMLLPTCPTTYQVKAVEADPVTLNSRMGLYTNFVNLLDYCAVAVPAGFRSDGLALGVTLIAPAHADEALALLSDRLHRALEEGACGAKQALADNALEPSLSGMIDVMVVGAHLSGMPLNHQLTDLNGTFVERVKTASDYRLYALPETSPPKPALIRQPGTQGPGLAAEIWRLTPDSYGRFVAMIPSPLGIGSIELDDGRFVQGFLGEAWAAEGAEDVTRFGGWRAYIEHLSG
ncbi:MAG: allophanate hydrolase [Alphaproteobacteria bacterium]